MNDIVSAERECQQRQDETSQQEGADDIIVGDVVGYGVASYAEGLVRQFGVEEAVAGQEALLIVVRDVDVPGVVTDAVARQMEGVGLLAVVYLSRLEPRLDGGVLLLGCGILWQ